jgi:tetratricopeptide (TPR) repeat protein
MIGRQQWIRTGVIAAITAALTLGLWLWLRPRPAAPPLPDLTDTDPESVEAITAAHRTVTQRPWSARDWGNLGMVLRAHDFEEECLVCFAQAEHLDPREPRWPYLQGLTRIHTEPVLGVRCLERTVELCGDDPPAPRLRLAEALLEAGRLDEAEAHLQRTLRYQPDSRRAWLGLARLALLRGEWQTALDQLKHCMQDEHGRRMARSLSAEAWGRLGNLDRARAEQREAELLPEDVRWPDLFADETAELQRGLKARILQADSLARSGQVAEAISLLEETAERHPKSLQARLKLGELWRERNRPDRAEETFRGALEIDPEAAETWFRLGTIQALRNRHREAAESLRTAIRLRPSHALAHYNLARCLLATGDSKGAAEELRTTLRCRPDYAPALSALKDLEPSGPGKAAK